MRQPTLEEDNAYDKASTYVEHNCGHKIEPCLKLLLTLKYNELHWPHFIPTYRILYQNNNIRITTKRTDLFINFLHNVQ